MPFGLRTCFQKEVFLPPEFWFERESVHHLSSFENIFSLLAHSHFISQTRGAGVGKRTGFCFFPSNRCKHAWSQRKFGLFMQNFPLFFAFAQICFNNGNSRDVEGSISCISGNWIGYAGKKGPYAPFCTKEKMCKKNPPTPKNWFFCGNTFWQTFGILKMCQSAILKLLQEIPYIFFNWNEYYYTFPTVPRIESKLSVFPHKISILFSRRSGRTFASAPWGCCCVEDRWKTLISRNCFISLNKNVFPLSPPPAPLVLARTEEGADTAAEAEGPAGSPQSQTGQTRGSHACLIYFSQSLPDCFSLVFTVAVYIHF